MLNPMTHPRRGTVQKRAGVVLIVMGMLFLAAGFFPAHAQENVELKTLDTVPPMIDQGGVVPMEIIEELPKEIPVAAEVTPLSEKIIDVVDDALKDAGFAKETDQISSSASSPDAKKQEGKAENAGAQKVLGKSKKIPSLFFTYWQHQSIMDALQSRGTEVFSETGEDTLTDEEKNGKPEDVPVKPENRDVSLSGIVFVNENDWTVWLNGMRLTPDAIPPEVIDLKVYKTHIDMKWYDEYSNKIFPIRIRPHQRFNLDTRVFLPG